MAIFIPVTTPPDAATEITTQIAAVIAAAISAYGYSQSSIVSIRRVEGKTWALAGRLASTTVRAQMY